MPPAMGSVSTSDADAAPVAAGRHGIFADAPSAVAAARAAFEQFRARPLADRKKAISIIRKIAIDSCVELGTMEMNETKIGRLDHKIEKLKTLGELSPGVEFLESQCYSGDHGLAVIERAPFGVIGAITPVTHSLPTITGNAVSMLAGGNAVVVNPHPSGRKVAAEGVRRYNEAIEREIGIDNLICVIAEPTLESAEALFKDRKVSLICVTGGPAVARAALNSGKRAIVAGPGNPPVVVDESADLDNAAKCIIAGAAYDNNLLCIAEKEVFVVDSVFDQMMEAMTRAGAARLNASQIAALTSKAIVKVGDDQHDARLQRLHRTRCLGAGRCGRCDRVARLRIGLRRNRRASPVRQRRTNDAVRSLCSSPRRRPRDRNGEAVRARLPAHGDHSLAQRSLDDQNGTRVGHDTLRQERSLHGGVGTRRRRLPFVLNRGPDRGRCHHADHVHP